MSAATTWRSSPSACRPDAITRLEAFVNAPFERIDYTDAVELLQKSGQKFEFPVEWGLDLQTEHERWLTEQHVGRPVVVTNYPEHIKAFYMRLNDDGKTVAAMDVLAPGIGEIIGGSQREERLDVLDARMAQFGLDRRALPAGTATSAATARVPHAGFGLGFERLVVYVCGLSNIRDAIPTRARPDRRSSDRMSADVVLFFALLFVAIADRRRDGVRDLLAADAGACPRSPTGIADELGTGAFLKPSALGWLLRGGYRAVRDPSLSGLATPARISLLGDLPRARHGWCLWLVVARHACARSAVVTA